jgi:Zn-dependent peptidase ImmA (M78 family)
LEYDLLQLESIPRDAQPHNLTFEQHKLIEGDAQYLARAVLLPKEMFIKQWNFYFDQAVEKEGQNREKCVMFCADKLEADFRFWALKIAYRASELKLMSHDECKKFFSDRIQM